MTGKSATSSELKVLVFELVHRGHRYQYVRALVEALDQIVGEIVFITGCEGTLSEEFDTHLADIAPRLTIVPVATSSGAVGHVRAAFTLIRTVRKHAPDHVLVPTGNAVLQIYGLLRPIFLPHVSRPFELEALLMSGGHDGRWWYDTAWSLATRMARISTLHTLYALQTRVYTRRRIRIAPTIRQSPEPIEELPVLDRVRARTLLGIPAGGRLVSMPGGISARKGSVRLLDAFLAANLAGDDVLVFAGKFETDTHQLIEERLERHQCRNVILIDEYLDQEKFFAVLDASDLVCLPYELSESSSGIAVRAASRGVPLLTTDTGWCGATIERYNLGVCVDTSDVTTFAASLADTINQAGHFDKTELNCAFCSFHSLVNFQAHWSERLRERAGVAAEIVPLRFENIAAADAEMSFRADPCRVNREFAERLPADHREPPGA